MHAAQRDATNTSKPSQTQFHAALRRHTSATAKRSAATHTRQQKAAIAILWHSTLLTALETAPAVRASYVARMTQPRCITFRRPNAHLTHMPTSAALPDTITPQTRAHTHAMRRAPPSTTARQRHGACHPKQRTPTTHTTHIAHSHAEYRHTSPTSPHDVPHSRNHCALHNYHHMHTAARTPRTARHTAPTTAQAAHRKSHPVTHAASAPHSR
jgi:hypothetical protein